MAFKIEIRDPQSGKALTFGPRVAGQVGKDILAIKIALGVVKKLEDNNPEFNEPAIVQGAQVPMDKQEWFDCQTGRNTDLETASTFDIHMQGVLKKYQMENSFLILSYFFEKLCIPNIISDMQENTTINQDKYKIVVEQQVDKVYPLFEMEFGQVGEATLAIMHGWRPSAQIENTGYVHPASIFPGTRQPIVFLIPANIVEAYGEGRFSQSKQHLLESGYLLSKYPQDPTRITDDNGNVLEPAVYPELSSVKLQQFKSIARSSKDWVFYNSQSESLPFDVYVFDYKVASSATSRLYEPAISVLGQTQQFSDPTLLDDETKEKRMKAFFYPNPFSTDEPFVIDTDKLGFFYETEYEIVADKLPSSDVDSIQQLEDLALQKVIELYDKPKIWNFLYNDDQLNVVYLNDNELRPEHSGVFPLEVGEERVKSSSTYRAIGLKINLLESRIERLQAQLVPSPSNRHRDMNAFETEINEKISTANTEISALKEQRERILSGEEFRKKDFWVLSTQDMIDLAPPGAIQSWRQVEVSGTEPLIKFVEFRTPPMRPGMKYRALMEINKEKLDLIIYGDNPEQQQEESSPQNRLTTENETNTPNSEDLVRVCPSQSTAESKRAYQELVAHARKKRKEFSRSLKEMTADRDTVPSTPDIDLGFFGPYNFNAAFSGLHGLSGITNDYEYTTKALKLLVETGSPLLEKMNIMDTAAEDLQQTIDSGIEKAESGDRDSVRYNHIEMKWSELKERIKTAADDLSEAAQVIQREGIQFIRGSNYKPDSEAQLVRRLATELDQIIGDTKIDAYWGLGDERLSISELEDLYKEEEIVVYVRFMPVDYDGLGPKNGKAIQSILISVQKKSFFGSLEGIPEPIYVADFFQGSLNKQTIGNYSALSRPRTVNYLSYVKSMTNPYPSSFGEFIKSFWDDGRSVCNELGIDSDKGLAISIVGNYTSGIQIDLSQDEDKLVEAFKDWSKKHFVNPTKKWLQQSGQNAVDSLNDTFDEQAALDAFGKLCTLEDLYKEFMDKLDLKSLLCDYLRCLKLPAFEFKLPSFYLPPWPKIPIIGWYGYLVYFLVKQIKQILIRILCTFARTIIDKLSIPFCEEQLQDFISAGSSATPIMNKALAEALTNTGITSGNEQKAKEFFDDVANLTTGQELCRLLEGQPLDAAAMQMLRRLAEKQGLSTDLDSDEAIVNYFGIVGAFVPFEVCSQLAELPNADILTVPGETQQECDELLSALAAIRNRLLSGDSSITDEEIDEVLDIQKKNLNDRKAEMEALSGANFDVLLPPEFKPGTQQNQNTIINSMPSFLANTVQSSAESLFLQAKSSYIGGLSSYVQSMKIRGPASPTAFDAEYDADSNLRMEAALEQIKNYTSLLQRESSPVNSSRAAYQSAAASGLFEDAKKYGLGDWENPANLGGNFRFLNTANRDLNDPQVRQENQRMIKELLKKEFLNTLKVKQIISAFTIFEKFGHDPMAAYMKYSREIRNSLEIFHLDTSNDPTGRNTKDMLDLHGLRRWWRVRPEGVGENGVLQDAYDFVDSSVRMGISQKEDWIRHGTDNAIRTFTLVTHELQDLPWYRNWAGLDHPNVEPALEGDLTNAERIANFSTELTTAEQQERTGYISQIFRVLDSLHSFSDLEIFCKTNLESQLPVSSVNTVISYNTAVDKNISLSRDMSSKDIIKPSDEAEVGENFGHTKLLNKFLEQVVDSFYPDEQSARNLSSLYGSLSEDDFIDSADGRRRKGLFDAPVGSPLFLVNDSRGREFIPVPGFGQRIMTSVNGFYSSIDDKDTGGYDLFLPLENPWDFEVTTPEALLNRTDSYYYGAKFRGNTRDLEDPMSSAYHRDYLASNVADPLRRRDDGEDGTGGHLPHEDNSDSGVAPAIGNYTDSAPPDGRHISHYYSSFPINVARDRRNSFRPSEVKNVLPINSYAVKREMVDKLSFIDESAQIDFRAAVGHPFHRRLAWGFEDITFNDGIPRRSQLLSSISRSRNLIDFHTSMPLYKAVVYNDQVLENQRLRTAKISFSKYNILENGTLNRHDGFNHKAFEVAKSEFSVLNRANFIYRYKNGEIHTHGDDPLSISSMSDETFAIGQRVWDPLGRRPESSLSDDIRGLWRKTFDKDEEMLRGYWGGPLEPTPLDPINPHPEATRGNQRVPVSERPMIGAPVFFMLPNRALQYIPGHFTLHDSGDSGHITKNPPSGRIGGTVQVWPLSVDVNEYARQDIFAFDEDYHRGVNQSGWHEDAVVAGIMVSRNYFLDFLRDRRKLVNDQLYMKIVKLLTSIAAIGREGTAGIPFVNKNLLQNFTLDVLQNRIRIFEQAMKIYGTRNEGEFESIFTGLDLPGNFEGFSTGAGPEMEITPEKVKKLFTPFELEKVSITNSNSYNLVHKRYYKDSEGQEKSISYAEFIEIIRDPLGVNWPRVRGNKVEFYFKPIKAVNNYSELAITPDDLDLRFEKSEGQRKEVNNKFLKAALGEDYGTEYISKELLYLKGVSTNDIPGNYLIVKNSFIRTATSLLLDLDSDKLIELAQLDRDRSTDVKKAYTNSGALLDIASNRIQELTSIILDVLQNQNQTFDFSLLPTISSTFSLIKKSSPEIGEHVNLSYLGGTDNEFHNIGYRFGMLPYTPGIKMVEVPTTGELTSDRYNIVVDSDINLGLSFNRNMINRNTSTDRENSEAMMSVDGSNKNFRKIFSFCEELPQSLKSVVSDRNYSNTEARREIFSKLVLSNLEETGAILNADGTRPNNEEMSAFKQTLQKEVFDEVVSNLMRDLTHSLQNSPMFDDEYAEEVNTRVSGKPIVTETTTGRCVSNRYSLESSSILSFKKVIIGDVFEEVMAEMSKPENSPFNRDFASPEPFDKAMKTVSVKAFIRLCMIDILLKGGIAYSVWDVEPIVSTSVFFEYIKEHVRTELDKSKTLRSVWGATLENSEGISNKMAALESVISKELIKLPQYSKQIFNPNSQDKDFYNWFIYGKTMFDGELPLGIRTTNKFFTKDGLIPRVPVPLYSEEVPMPLIGKTHLGNPTSRLSNDASSGFKNLFSTHRDFTKEQTSSTPQPIYDTPTSRLVYEDYFRLSGKILDFLDGVSGIANPDSRTRRDPSTGEVVDNSFIVNYEEMSTIMLGLLARERFVDLAPDNEDFISWEHVMNESEIKIGKRLCLYLVKSYGTRNDTNQREVSRSTIPELISKIHESDVRGLKTKLSTKERAYQIAATLDMQRGENSPTPKPNNFASVPLTSYEREMSISECMLIRDYFQSEITPTNEGTVPAEFYLSISEKFSETQGFKDYLEHLFPVRRYMAVSSLFSTAVLGGFNEVPGILAPAKAMVAFVGMVCATPPEKRQDILSIDQADWAKMMREKSPGDMNEGDCFEFPGITEEFFKEFWKELLKIMYYFPSILFRGIANVLDPAYKEMRTHYMNCDIQQLNWRGVAWYSTRDVDESNKLTNGLYPGDPQALEPKGLYAPVFPAALSDFGIGAAEAFSFNFFPLLQATLKTVSYAYSGMLPFVDLSNAFKVPCADIDEDYGPGGKYDAGRFGRYGHPISPFTALALSTLQLPNDIDRRKSACVIKESGGEEQLIPDADCDEQIEE